VAQTSGSASRLGWLDAPGSYPQTQSPSPLATQHPHQSTKPSANSHGRHRTQPVHHRKAVAVSQKPGPCPPLKTPKHYASRVTGVWCPPGPLGTAHPIPMPRGQGRGPFAPRVFSFPPQNVSHCPFWEAQRVGDAPLAPALLRSEREHCSSTSFGVLGKNAWDSGIDPQGLLPSQQGKAGPTSAPYC